MYFCSKSKNTEMLSEVQTVYLCVEENNNTMHHADQLDTCSKYYYSTFFQHSDINECLTVYNGGCNQTCTDTMDSVKCSCGTGFRLDTDNRTCNGKGKVMHLERTVQYCLYAMAIETSYVDSSARRGLLSLDQRCLYTI